MSILDTRVKNGAIPRIAWSGSGTKNIRVGTVLDVQVKNPDGSAASGAMVQVFGDAKLVYRGTTDSQGRLSNIPLVTSTYTQARTDPKVITATTSGPFTIKTTIGTRTSSVVVTPSDQEASSVVIQ